MPNNEMQWSSDTPGLLIFLIDQSGSMTQEYVNGESRSEFASRILNELINKIIDKNYDGDSPKNRCHIAVIGYNHNVKCLVSGYLSELDEMVDRGEVEIINNVPTWIKPINEDGATNMKEAFKKAKDIIDKWIDVCPGNPAPVIINITDGHPYFDGKEMYECMDETTEVVNQINNIDTQDGKVQIFNAMVGDGNKIAFPISSNDLVNAEAKFLYEISTVIPESYRAAAAKYKLNYPKGARGAVYQADGKALIDLINFGSSKSSPNL